MQKDRYHLPGAAVLVVLAVCLTSPLAWAADKPAGEPSIRSVNRGVADSPRRVVLDELPQATREELAAHPAIRRPLNGLTDEQYWALKKRMRQSLGRGTGSGTLSPAHPGNKASITPFFADFSRAFLGLDQAKVFPDKPIAPSDMALAVGPKFVLEAINGGVTVTDKNGKTQKGFPKSSSAFFALPAEAFTSDTRAFYDWVNDRYVVIMLHVDFTAQQGFVRIAASATGDPRGRWHIFELPVGNTGQCADFPTLGQDHTNWTNEKTGAIYMGFNLFTSSTGFCNPDGTLADNHLLVLPKSSIYAGQGFTYTDVSGFTVGGTLVDTMQPADVSNLADHPRAEFLVNSFNTDFGGMNCMSGCNGLVVWAVSNPFGFLTGGPDLEISASVIGTRFTYFMPATAEEPGCADCVDTGDNRISGTVKYSAGALFGALETVDPVNGTGENSPIWFELHPILNDNDDARCAGSFANLCPQITAVDERQEDCFVCGGFVNHASAYFATLQPDPENNVTMVYNYSDSANFPGVVITSRRVTQADNTMNGLGVFVQEGTGFYGLGRFGDYSGTAPDLTAANSPMMWFAGMFAEPSCGSPDSPPLCNWGTVIGENGYTSPDQH